MRVILSLATLAACLVVTAPVSAQSSSSSLTVTGLSLALTDRVPGDGSAPSVSFDDTIGESASVFSALLSDYSNGRQVVMTSPAPLSGEAVASSSGLYWSGTALAIGDVFDGSGQVGAIVSTEHPVGDSSAVISVVSLGGSTSIPGNGVGFTLSPGTTITVSGHVSMGASGRGFGEDGGASVALAFVGDDPASQGSAFEDSVSFGATAGTVSRDEDFSISFTNDAAAPVRGVFDSLFIAEAYNYDVRAVVPEPAGSALLAAGLALLAVVAQRRRAPAGGQRSISWRAK